jgi:hypothetical protein
MNAKSKTPSEELDKILEALLVELYYGGKSGFTFDPKTTEQLLKSPKINEAKANYGLCGMHDPAC